MPGMTLARGSYSVRASTAGQLTRPKLAPTASAAPGRGWHAKGAAGRPCNIASTASRAPTASADRPCRRCGALAVEQLRAALRECREELVEPVIGESSQGPAR